MSTLLFGNGLYYCHAFLCRLTFFAVAASMADMNIINVNNEKPLEILAVAAASLGVSGSASRRNCCAVVVVREAVQLGFLIVIVVRCETVAYRNTVSAASVSIVGNKQKKTTAIHCACMYLAMCMCLL